MHVLCDPSLGRTEAGMGSWPTSPAKPQTVYKTRENLATRPPPGSFGCNQEKLNTLPLAKTRRSHLALTGHLLLRPLASILRVGCNKTPSSQNLKDLVPGSPETTPSSCACAIFLLQAQYQDLPCAPCSLPLCEELQEEGFVSRAEENDGMA